MPRGTPATINLDAQAAQQMVKANNEHKTLMQIFQNEEKRTVRIAPQYQPHFGRVMHVEINTISVFVPVDGSAYQIPASFADEVEARMKAVNDMLLKQHRMSDIPQNIEASPGELKLF